VPPQGVEATPPLRPAHPQPAAQLETMARPVLVRPPSAPAAPGYDFHPAIIEQVAYELLPLVRRRELHEAAALWCEGLQSSRPSFAVLAHHWTRAQVVPRALDALEKAGEQALRSGFFREATLFFGQAVALGAGQPG